MSDAPDSDSQRGLAPDGSSDPEVASAPELPPIDPSWIPSGIDKHLEERIGETLRRRRRSQLWFPHLLIRGAPGDTGQRPLWEPTPCWLSPDIHLIPAGAPIDLSHTVQSPVVGQQYTVAVHVWNLGRFPATGVTVRAWWVEPGFFSGTPDPKYHPHFIGGTFTELGDRDSGEAHRIVAIPQPWLVQDQEDGHECLLAVVEAFTDPWTGVLAPNTDRHVGQRNLTLIRGAQDTASIFNRLDERTEPGDRIEVLLGGLTPARLVAAVERGAATSTDPPEGRGPLLLDRVRRHSTITRTMDGWSSDQMPGGAAFPRLTDVITASLGASGSTAAELLASTLLSGARNAALHFATTQTGYTVVLRE